MSSNSIDLILGPDPGAFTPTKQPSEPGSAKLTPTNLSRNVSRDQGTPKSQRNNTRITENKTNVSNDNVKTLDEETTRRDNSEDRNSRKERISTKGTPVEIRLNAHSEQRDTPKTGQKESPNSEQRDTPKTGQKDVLRSRQEDMVIPTKEGRTISKDSVTLTNDRNGAIQIGENQTARKTSENQTPRKTSENQTPRKTSMQIDERPSRQEASSTYIWHLLQM